MPTLYLASRNLHKAQEMQSLLGADWIVKPCQEIDASIDWEENGDSFRANALIKAKALQAHASVAVLADDSGLEVQVLEGAPGIHTARYAGPGASDKQNWQKLLRVLEGMPLESRNARFVCVLCYLDLNGNCHYFEGACEGHIALEPSGSSGFGYDPIFVPNGFQQSFAELGEEEKNRISHRALAMQSFRQFLGESETKV